MAPRILHWQFTALNGCMACWWKRWRKSIILLAEIPSDWTRRGTYLQELQLYRSYCFACRLSTFDWLQVVSHHGKSWWFISDWRTRVLGLSQCLRVDHGRIDRCSLVQSIRRRLSRQQVGRGVCPGCPDTPPRIMALWAVVSIIVEVRRNEGEGRKLNAPNLGERLMLCINEAIVGATGSPRVNAILGACVPELRHE